MNDFIKNPQTRNARAFLPLNISPVGSVNCEEAQRNPVVRVGRKPKIKINGSAPKGTERTYTTGVLY